MVHVLLLGGHGKIALRITKLLAAQNFRVTSIIRDPAHIPDIHAVAPVEDPTLVNPVVASLEDADEHTASELMNGVDWVVWSAGAGGKGGPQRTKAVDEAAAKRFISAALSAPSVRKFLTISASAARRDPASYWSPEDITTFRRAWEALPVYCEAKVNADDFLWDESRKTTKEGWEDIHLRPGMLTDAPATGKVDLGRAKVAGGVSREDVASVAVELLKKGGAGGLWIDLLGGEEPVESAVERVVSQRVSAREEEK